MAGLSAGISLIQRCDLSLRILQLIISGEVLPYSGRSDSRWDSLAHPPGKKLPADSDAQYEDHTYEGQQQRPSG